MDCYQIRLVNYVVKSFERSNMLDVLLKEGSSIVYTFWVLEFNNESFFHVRCDSFTCGLFPSDFMNYASGFCQNDLAGLEMI